MLSPYAKAFVPGPTQQAPDVWEDEEVPPVRLADLGSRLTVHGRTLARAAGCAQHPCVSVKADPRCFFLCPPVQRWKGGVHGHPLSCLAFVLRRGGALPAASLLQRVLRVYDRF